MNPVILTQIIAQLMLTFVFGAIVFAGVVTKETVWIIASVVSISLWVLFFLNMIRVIISYYFVNCKSFLKKTLKKLKIIICRQFPNAIYLLFFSQVGKYKIVICPAFRQPPFASARRDLQVRNEAL